VRSLDPRLLRRAPPVRHLLAADVAAGLGIALLVLLQAVLLALVFAGRGALAWTVEVAGRRAAQSVLSELRLALVERRLTAQPTAADGTSEGEVVAAAVQGVDGLEAYFARYLPQVVLA
jgi:ABC-type transport system involved in cytochrome bd biosynthesis fused ATPase/permease subunit